MEGYHLIAFAAKERRLLPHETHDYHVSISLATCCTLYPIAVHGQEELSGQFPVNGRSTFESGHSSIPSDLRPCTHKRATNESAIFSARVYPVQDFSLFIV